MNYRIGISQSNIEMKSNSNLNDVGLFIASLLSFNDLNLNADLENKKLN